LVNEEAHLTNRRVTFDEVKRHFYLTEVMLAPLINEEAR